MSTDKVVIEVSAEEAAKIEAMRARIAQEERKDSPTLGAPFGCSTGLYA